MIWHRLRADIAAARRLLDEREAAIAACEQAHARLREFYDMPPKGKRAPAVQPDLPPEPLSPVLEPPRRSEGHIVAGVGAAGGCGAASAWLAMVRTCERCRAAFEPHHGRQRFCTVDCRMGRKPNGEGLTVRECAYCADPYQPRDAEQTTCSDLCRKLLREDSYAREHEKGRPANDRPL